MCTRKEEADSAAVHPDRGQDKRVCFVSRARCQLESSQRRCRFGIRTFVKDPKGREEGSIEVLEKERLAMKRVD